MSETGAEQAQSVPASQLGMWTSFLKSLASYNGDLSSMTAPPFILSSVSLTEYSQFWTEISDLFTGPASEPDPEKRMVAVVKWFIGTLRGQYCSRSENLGSEKKPLNPFLGELFIGQWSNESEDNKTVLVSEQVSHHPPVTAYNIWNDKHGVQLQGFNGIKSSISATSLTITVKQVGHAMLHIKKFDEYYLITLPALHIEGLFGGAPFVELEKKTHIVSSSGYVAELDYSGRGYFSGKKNSFKAKIASLKNRSAPLYSIKGRWSKVSHIKDEKTGTEELFWDAEKATRAPLEVKPIEQQLEKESRKAWQKVAEAVKLGDYSLIQVEKSKIENEQRELRKIEQENGITWKHECFVENPDPSVDPFEKAYLKLAPQIDHTLEHIRFRFSEEMYAKSAYRP
ncbi:hypothetical protein CANCADRAFT_122919 [Tortispora caseinolytica NRRL Y-17796]|uniref:Oxysterol-binding protein n=1 Tax=Tortispora caseinolytica NRRL Y-17796 TaxID=767744 RepID=A0A1E4THZ4_9ASCO|nr:hypothetical protein CANCADRAFT_122919 [Tortispora caseinolytica NRRL Y-17796]